MRITWWANLTKDPIESYGSWRYKVIFTCGPWSTSPLCCHSICVFRPAGAAWIYLHANYNPGTTKQTLFPVLVIPAPFFFYSAFLPMVKLLHLCGLDSPPLGLSCNAPFLTDQAVLLSCLLWNSLAPRFVSELLCHLSISSFLETLPPFTCKGFNTENIFKAQ